MRHIHCKLLLAFAFLLFTLPLSATERGVKRVGTSGTEDRHALVIGNSTYTQPPHLEIRSMTLGGF